MYIVGGPNLPTPPIPACVQGRPVLGADVVCLCVCVNSGCPGGCSTMGEAVEGQGGRGQGRDRGGAGEGQGR